MVRRRTNKGAVVDFEALMAQNKNTPAVGNMKVNAKGDVLGKGGEVVQKNEDRVRAYYKDNPRSSTKNISVKGSLPEQLAAPEAPKPTEEPLPEVKKPAPRKAKKAKLDPVEPVDDPFTDDDAKPLRYKEVELPNGDIQMVPVYKDDEDGDE